MKNQGEVKTETIKLLSIVYENLLIIGPMITISKIMKISQIFYYFKSISNKEKEKFSQWLIK